MFEPVIILLIQVCALAAVCWLVIWALGQAGIALPPQVVKIFWVIVALIVILMLYRLIGPTLRLR